MRSQDLRILDSSFMSLLLSGHETSKVSPSSISRPGIRQRTGPHGGARPLRSRSMIRRSAMEPKRRMSVFRWRTRFVSRNSSMNWVCSLSKVGGPARILKTSSSSGWSRRYRFSMPTIVAFGSTRKASNSVRKDKNLHALLESGTRTITLFGKSWSFQVTDALGISLAKNLELIEDSIHYLRSKDRRVFYDAEHFFDGYKANPDYALQTIRRAIAGGAERVILCDTNGGTMPWEIREICRVVKQECPVPLGIHAHNDSEMAVANSLVAVESGIQQVQGTINGIGERCGNANLCSIIPNLQLKMRRPALGNKLTRLKTVSAFVTEIANLMPNKRQPYVGDAAFAHKGGVHIHAVLKNAATYEHIAPEEVGNRRRMLVSDYAGRSGLMEKVEAYGISLTKNHAKLQELIETLKERESQGYQFEGAEGSFELLMRKAMGSHRPSFQLLGFRVIVEKKQEQGMLLSEATVMVKVGDVVEHTAAVGAGPVNALDHAFARHWKSFIRNSVKSNCWTIKYVCLSANRGTESKVRVLIESGDHKDKWGTVGVSENIMEASWQALADSIEYKLLLADRV